MPDNKKPLPQKIKPHYIVEAVSWVNGPTLGEEIIAGAEPTGYVSTTCSDPTTDEWRFCVIGRVIIQQTNPHAIVPPHPIAGKDIALEVEYAQISGNFELTWCIGRYELDFPTGSSSITFPKVLILAADIENHWNYLLQEPTHGGIWGVGLTVKHGKQKLASQNCICEPNAYTFNT